MKVTHEGLFNRAAESYDFGAIWAIEDRCRRELEEAEKAYETARYIYEHTKKSAARSFAYSEMYYAFVQYYEKFNAYQKFYC